MSFSKQNLVKGLSLILLGLAIGGCGIYIGETDDAPGAGVGGLVLMTGLILLGIRILRRRPSFG